MSESRRPLIHIENGFAFGALVALGLAASTLIVCATWYNRAELNVKREVLARGASPLEIQCIFASSTNYAACLLVREHQK